MRISTVGLDADDTLWHNETLFRLTQDRFCDLLSDKADPEALMARLAEVEARNLRLYGYGVKGFTLSMIETAMELSHGEAPASVVREILAAGREMLNEPVEPLPGVEAALADLSKDYRLVLITKGDLVHQTHKIDTSGLAHHFHHLEIVLEKDVDTYARLLRRWEVAPERFCMVGNSVRSDILPVMALGGHGVHVPYHLLWELEHVEHDEHVTELSSLADLPALLGC